MTTEDIQQIKLRTKLIWDRQWPNSNANFDVILKNPEVIDAEALATLLGNITSVSHRSVTLNASSTSEFLRWFDDTSSPLKAHAYVLVSNWFLSGGGDASSNLARHCEVFWDALFASRPAKRLSSAVRGRNHIVLPHAFELFWPRLVEVQNNSPESAASEDSVPLSIGSAAPMNGMGRVRTTIFADNVRCEAEGYPEPIAELMRLIASWNTSK